MEILADFKCSKIEEIILYERKIFLNFLVKTVNKKVALKNGCLPNG